MSRVFDGFIRIVLSLIFVYFIVATVLSITGCAMIREQIAADKKLMATPYYDGSDKIDPYDRASYYASQYPTCTPSEKADMLYQCLKREGHDPIMMETARIVIDKSIMLNGEKIWPVQVIKRYEAGKLQEIETLGGKHMTIEQAKDNN